MPFTLIHAVGSARNAAATQNPLHSPCSRSAAYRATSGMHAIAKAATTRCAARRWCAAPVAASTIGQSGGKLLFQGRHGVRKGPAEPANQPALARYVTPSAPTRAV